MIYLKPELLASVDAPGGLQRLLQKAIELEHATIPTYLYSLYSLGTSNTKIQSLVLSVVIEEMLHFALACNILNAIGGAPEIDKPDFIPRFPGPLPGGVDADLTVHLKRFSLEHVHKTFMAIEEPEDPLKFRDKAAAVHGVTIGQYYERIKKEIAKAGQKIFTGHHSRQVTAGFPSTELFKVTDVETACKAIDLIREQGEGTSTSPLDPEHDPAHYYRFAEIWHGKSLRAVTPPPPPGTPDDQKYRYDGEPIPFVEADVIRVIDDPSAAKYPPDTQAHYLNDNFNYTYTSLLKALHLTFNGQPDRMDSAIAVMHSMRELAMEMMTVPFEKDRHAGPSFEYQPVNR
jgi:Ferritin-like